MRKIYLSICITTMSVMLAIAFTPKKVTSVSGNQQQSPPTREQKLQQDRESKRESFKSGRDLLRKHGVPFDPDSLLEPGFKNKLASTFAAMHEFRESRLVGKQIEGVQLADTLFLPETVELTGDTVIIANQLIFSGKNVVIKGPHDLHFFAMGPVQSVDLGAQRGGRGRSATSRQAFRRRSLRQRNVGANWSSRTASRLILTPWAMKSGWRARRPMLRTFVTTITRGVPIPRRISISHPGPQDLKDLMAPFQRNLLKQTAAHRELARPFQTEAKELMGTKRRLREMVEQGFEVLMGTMGVC